MNIVRAIRDEQLLKSFLQDTTGSIATWHNWEIFLRCLFGLPVRKPKNVQLVKECTGRDTVLLPKAGFDKAIALVGRRSGKSKISAVIGAYAASLSGQEKLLSKGERGLVVICSPTKLQSSVILNYLKAIYEIPLLAQEVVQQDRTGITLRNNVRIQILTGQFHVVRGFTVLCAILDELAFFGLTDESRPNIKSDTELVRAVLPSLATVKGKLIGISTPYRRAGYCWTAFKRNHGNDKGRTLIWNCPSSVMNPTLDPQIVCDALEEDLAAGQSEYLAIFRDDVQAFLSRETVAAVVVKNRQQLLGVRTTPYTIFCDIGGGRHDSASIAVAHQDPMSHKTILDCVREYKSPFSPQAVIRQMSQVVRDYHCGWLLGDNYSAEFCAQEFRQNGIGYRKCDRNKSAIYLEFLPRLTSGKCELLDNETLISQLCGLERRVRSGGADKIDHPPHGGADDVCNAACGAIVECSRPRIRMGGWRDTSQRRDDPRERLHRWLKEKHVRLRKTYEFSG